MTIEQEAAQSLISRAMSETRLSTALILIESAHRLDNSIDVQEQENIWLQSWMIRENEKRS